MMECLNRYIVACAHLGNGTGRSMATLAAPLLLVLLTSGPVRYEAIASQLCDKPSWGY